MAKGARCVVMSYGRYDLELGTGTKLQRSMSSIHDISCNEVGLKRRTRES